MNHIIKIIQILVILASISSLFEPHLGFSMPLEQDMKNNLVMFFVHILAIVSVIQFIFIGIKSRRGEIPAVKKDVSKKAPLPTSELKPNSSEYILRLNKKAFIALVVLALIVAYVRGSADIARHIADSPVGIYSGNFIGSYLVLIIVYRIFRGGWGSSDDENKKKIMRGLGVTFFVFTLSLLSSLGFL